MYDVLFIFSDNLLQHSHPIINFKVTFFSNRPSDRAQILHACADRYSHLKKN